MWTYVVAPRPRKEKKMKNWEKYEKEIKEIGSTNLAVDRAGKIKHCLGIECEDCIGYDGECDKAITIWLYQEVE